MNDEKLIDLEGAYEDLKEYLLNISINCGNCNNKGKKHICKKCELACFWELNPAVVDEIEEKNIIENDEEDELEPKKILCPKCGEELTVDTTYQLASNPPKYETFCKCGYDGTIYCKDYLERG